MDLVDLKPIAKGIISTDQEESFPTYDHLNEELYFTRESKIYRSKYENNNWQNPKLLSFSSEFNDSAPHISQNGNRILFTSNRPNGKSSFKKKNLWIAYKTGETWVDPEIHPSPINIDSIGDYHASISNNGNIYFVSYSRKGGYGRSDLYVAVLNEDKSYKVTNLGDHINSDKSEADVYVDPDEEYLLFASTGRSDSYGADDIYISFKYEDVWSTPNNLGSNVNSYAYEYGAWVDRFNGYLYFNSYRRGTSDIYRVSLKEIELLNRQEAESLNY